MLYHLLYPLRDIIFAFNVFRYITFRAAMAALTAFVLSLIFGPLLINKLKALKIGEKINKADSQKLDDLHHSKQSTPTMGGILILGTVIISTLLWADIAHQCIWIVLFSTVWLGLTGFVDDYLKQIKKKASGLSPKVKLASQIILGLILGTVLIYNRQNVNLEIPFLKGVNFDLDGLYILFVILVIAGTSNAVNLTDGLDGLAIGIVVMVAVAFSILCYVSGNINLSNYLLVPYIKGSGELTIFCASIIGAGLGFLWFNCYPATIFMGDVGSLALGGAIGTVALLIKKEMLLIIVGGIFVLEALSVILQVGTYKLTKKRIFKIAPLHHHFQFLDWPENKVIVRFWIIAGLLALFTLITLKIR
ncbi:MAG: phospho-N-acetylmuramoyl-pentapeptide-transferase [Candidatus Omnitrophica bacterium]|nr:phospho-N-acetylmuramoyl-pentapeptide-transferase [Candidatus Omnitrophota bacterium]MBU4302898.1 phospho-N-acetylmuramoyl-pentapeptide-transferase [Candidatus Omnitrophota bacterium]MBU4418829.1 phospho-N-acetylmuramoyl-pentapeptide-transferase [Candidatus Omnitrophota bacterium]MBU4468146.1 phospho-N-acetylmuramoyl-pentapeptide-transferase [Candidatus Omnitrophota bacterium]MCG2707608.1 phospho-N-acetylmuramoyl-pentapeptide-transferase [Candidatus Omnitrophota bacterium]